MLKLLLKTEAFSISFFPLKRLCPTCHQSLCTLSLEERCDVFYELGSFLRQASENQIKDTLLQERV